MANNDGGHPMERLKPESANVGQAPMKKRSVTINDQKPEIVEIHEKHGPLHSAIPKMPLFLAIVCCLLNIVLPGLGTFISSFTVFCGSPTRIERPVKACLINILTAFLQMATFVAIVGWIWSIMWGMTFVQLSLSGDATGEMPYFVRRQSSVEVGALAGEPSSAVLNAVSIHRASTTTM